MVRLTYLLSGIGKNLYTINDTFFYGLRVAKCCAQLVHARSLQRFEEEVGAS